jgi:anti-sigma regulatory factor (Ser/Thr protein kinase)
MLAVPAAVKQARDLVSSAMTYWQQREDRIEDARVVASELVTNAATAKPHGEIRLRVTLHENWVRISVWDSIPLAPELRHPASYDETGRGLHIVAALTITRGTYPEDGGKVVYADLPRT